MSVTKIGETVLDGVQVSVELREPEQDYLATSLDVNAQGSPFGGSDWLIYNKLWEKGLIPAGRKFFYLTSFEIEGVRTFRFQEVN